MLRHKIRQGKGMENRERIFNRADTEGLATEMQSEQRPGE